jgi:hypothetical protein
VVCGRLDSASVYMADVFLSSRIVFLVDQMSPVVERSTIQNYYSTLNALVPPTTQDSIIGHLPIPLSNWYRTIMSMKFKGFP